MKHKSRNITVELSGSLLDKFEAIARYLAENGMLVRNGQVMRALASVPLEKDELRALVAVEAGKGDVIPKGERSAQFSVQFSDEALENFDRFFLGCRARGLQGVYYNTLFRAVIQQVTLGLELKDLMETSLRADNDRRVRKYRRTWEKNRHGATKGKKGEP